MGENEGALVLPVLISSGLFLLEINELEESCVLHEVFASVSPRISPEKRRRLREQHYIASNTKVEDEET